MQIQQKISHDIVKSVFLIDTKFWSDMMSHCSVVAELKYAILQWTNKDPAIIFTCNAPAPPTAVPGWVDERITVKNYSHLPGR